MEGVGPRWHLGIALSGPTPAGSAGSRTDRRELDARTIASALANDAARSIATRQADAAPSVRRITEQTCQTRAGVPEGAAQDIVGHERSNVDWIDLLGQEHVRDAEGCAREAPLSFAGLRVTASVVRFRPCNH
jgi:hypothetical protein